MHADLEAARCVLQMSIWVSKPRDVWSSDVTDLLIAHARNFIPQTDLSVGVLAVLVRGAHQPGDAAETLPATILY